MNLLFKKEFYLIFITMIALVFASILHYIIILVLLAFILATIKKENLVYITLFTFLSIPGSLDAELRNLINLINILILLYLVIDKYELNVKQLSLIPSQLIYFMSFIVISLFLSSIFSNDYLTGLKELIRQTIFFIVIILYYLILNKNNYKKVFQTLVASSLFVSVTIFISFIVNDGFNMIKTMGLVQIGGLSSNVAESASLIAIGIPLTIYYLYSAKSKIFLLSSLILLQFFALLLTNSRASFFILITSVITFLVYKYKYKALIAVFISTAIVLVIIFFSPLSDILSTYFRVNRILENTRYILWGMSIDMIKDHWLFGVGPGQFNTYLYNYLPVMLGTWQEQQLRFLFDNITIGHSHNFYLFRTVELGLLGLLSVILIPFLFFKNIILAIKNNKVTSFLVLLIGIVLGIFIRAIFESTGILTHGWITRDLIFWIIFIFVLNNAENENPNTI